MPDRLKAILEKIKEWWLKFTTKQKTLLISITAVVILALVILAVVMTKPTMVQLITCEDATQASSVRIRQMQIFCLVQTVFRPTDLPLMMH